jgi:four helix bundle protein
MNQDHPKLHHEDLDVYRAAIEFLALVASIVDQYPRGYGSMAEQFRKAALSIPLNTAEGFGKRSQPDRSRYYDIARGSGHECGALLDASKVLQVIDEPTFAKGKTLLHRIVSMLVKMST